MLRSRAPKKLWDFYLTYVTDNQPLIAHPMYKMEGRTPYEILTRDMPDILEFIE